MQQGIEHSENLTTGTIHVISWFLRALCETTQRNARRPRELLTIQIEDLATESTEVNREFGTSGWDKTIEIAPRFSVFSVASVAKIFFQDLTIWLRPAAALRRLRFNSA